MLVEVSESGVDAGAGSIATADGAHGFSLAQSCFFLLFLFLLDFAKSFRARDILLRGIGVELVASGFVVKPFSLRIIPFESD